ncbi:hypothetical protein V7124_14665 [Neobacillus niacini]|uniref:hypothetical protein n=1 Tax=Neobacillus niacini TaxID=86668 RepID=UPI002FFED6A3
MNDYGYPSQYGPESEPNQQQARFGGGQQPGFLPPTYSGGQQGLLQFSGGQQGFPPFGGGQQGFPPFGGGQQQGDAPSTPPPSYTPQESVSAFAVDPGAIRGCLYRFTFVWLNSGNSFWFYPTFVGRDSVAGYRWRNFRWVYYGTDLRRIRSFRCS